MRLKLDENLGRERVAHLLDAGHDVDTVHDENLRGADDRIVLDAAVEAGRALVTRDLDVSNPLRFPPAYKAICRRRGIRASSAQPTDERDMLAVSHLQPPGDRGGAHAHRGQRVREP